MPVVSFDKSKLIYVAIALAIAVNFSGLWVTLLGPDAARYAAVAKVMVLHHNYVELFSDGLDWLDKPHFPFWVTALSFKLFGITTPAYKLPGILFLMMGAAYTYWFAKNLYNKEVALWSVLILLTAEHIILSDTDVRAEAYLTGLIIGSVYHFYKALTAKGYGHLLLGALLAACAIMTKGIFAIIPIAGAIAGHLIIVKNWKALFHIRWLLAAVLIFIFILPELYCLYYQFDLHPGKMVFGKTGVSGIRFFFWDSQFGRFFNSGPIKGEGDLFFFLHTTLWAFLPWSILLYVAIFTFIKAAYRRPQNTQWYSITGALSTFVVFSVSKFQLPHYLNIVFPFFAIITAEYLYRIQSAATLKRVAITQTILVVLLISGTIALQIFYRPERVSFIAVLMLVAVIAFGVSIKLWPGSGKQKMVCYTAAGCLFFNFYLNLVFYPSLMHYQSGSEAAFWINKNNSGGLPVTTIESSYPLDFYLNQPLSYKPPEKMVSKPYLLYLPADSVAAFSARGWKMKVVKEFDHFPVSQLTLPFINKATRNKAVQKMDIAVVQL